MSDSAGCASVPRRGHTVPLLEPTIELGSGPEAEKAYDLSVHLVHGPERAWREIHQTELPEPGMPVHFCDSVPET